jgi:preprotein translocase subunit SecE
MASQALDAGSGGRFGRIVEFFREVRAELRKVTWPTWEELKKATTVIVIFVAILGLVIGWMDWLLQQIFVVGVAKLF